MQLLTIATLLYITFANNPPIILNESDLEEYKCAGEGSWCTCTGEIWYTAVGDCWYKNSKSKKDVVGGVQCSNGEFGDAAPGCNKKCTCYPDHDLNFHDYNLASSSKGGKSTDCTNLGCSTESGGLKSCRQKCENDANCNVFAFCSKHGSCPTTNRCCIRQCSENDDVAEYDLKLTSRWGGWNVFAKRKVIPDYTLQMPHTYGHASECNSLGCSNTSNVEECKKRCDDNSNCNVMLYSAEGSSSTSGVTRCCIRDCAGAVEYEDLKLTTKWKGWDVWTKDSRKNE